jgi:hypothetical protein
MVKAALLELSDIYCAAKFKIELDVILQQLAKEYAKWSISIY